MATTKTYTFVNSQPADATQINKNFDDLLAGINADVSATDKVLGRATAGAGPVEEIACTAAGRALIDDADAAAQRATLGAAPSATAVVGPASATDNAIVRFDAATGKLVQNSSVFIDDAGNVGIGTTNPAAKLQVTDGGNVGDAGGAIAFGANAGVSPMAQIKGGLVYLAGGADIGYLAFYTRPNVSPYTLTERMRISDLGNVTIAGQAAVVTGDARLSDARTPVAHNQLKATITDFPASMPASDVSAWAKAATRGITTGVVTVSDADVTVTYGLGTTPSYVGVTINTVGAFYAPIVTTITSTTFKILAGAVTARTTNWTAVA